MNEFKVKNDKGMRRLKGGRDEGIEGGNGPEEVGKGWQRLVTEDSEEPDDEEDKLPGAELPPLVS